jgi:lysozyme family protein
MSSLLDRSLEVVLGYEGAVFGGSSGYVNHPSDPGGATVAGVSLRAVVGLRDDDGTLQFDLDGDGDVDANDILRLAELWKRGDYKLVTEFYVEHYWDKTKCGEIRWPFCLTMFDAAVNHGPQVAIVQHQKAFGVTADGKIGPASLKAFNSKPDREALVKTLVIRARLYHDLSVKRGNDFYNGWMKRLFELEAESLRRA